MKPLISVIVPVYKVEKYFVRCLDSLCSQSLRDIEIILVDDVSPDRCGEICEEYAKNDSRIKVIHHLQNRGLSAARNTGIANASGNYLMFVDSDDYVHENFSKKPYESAMRCHADLVMFDYQCVDSFFFKSKANQNKSKTFESLKSGFKTTEQSLLMLYNVLGHFAWNKLYHKDLFKTVSYPEGYLFEDMGTTYKTIIKASRIYYLNSVLYYYRYSRKGSISTIRTKKSLQDWITMNLQQYRDLVKWIGSSEKLLDLIYKNIAMTYCVKKKRDISDSDYLFYENYLRTCNTIPKDFTMERKILFVFLKYCPPMFELICMLCGKKCC